MKWMEPGLIKLSEEQRRELNLAVSYEEAWADVGGFHNFVVECSARHGAVARVIDLEVSDDKVL